MFSRATYKIQKYTKYTNTEFFKKDIQNKKKTIPYALPTFTTIFSNDEKLEYFEKMKEYQKDNNTYGNVKNKFK